MNRQLLEISFDNLALDDTGAGSEANMGVCNNACWTIDELTLWMGTEAVGPYAG